MKKILINLFCLQVRALLGRHVVKVACGSRDAQTLALDNEGMVYSWGDGDFGKLGRGGSETCDIPCNIEYLNGKGVIHIDCGAQFSLALTKSGQVMISLVFEIVCVTCRKYFIIFVRLRCGLGVKEITIGLEMELISMFENQPCLQL